jgi:hypothetical protein
MKICSKCKFLKEEGEFYRCKDKPSSWCRKCQDAATMKWRSKHPERAAENARRGMDKWREANRGTARSIHKKWAQANPDKAKRSPERDRVGASIRYAVKTGRITRPGICSRCRSEGSVELHHPDYSMPLYVIPLCKACHGMTRHKFNRLECVGERWLSNPVTT